MTTEEKLAKELEDARASIKALEAKNAEVIGINKRAKAEAEEARQAAEAAAEEKARSEKDVEALEKSLTAKFEKTIKTLTADLATRDASLKMLLIDNAIQTGMNEHKIAAPYQEAFAALVKSQAVLEGDVAKVGDVSLGDYMKTFVASDKGKAFVAAPANSGADAMGSNVSAASFTKENFTEDKYWELASKDMKKADEVATKLGLDFLK